MKENKKKGWKKLYKVLVLGLVLLMFPLQAIASETASGSKTSLTIYYPYGQTTFSFYKIAAFSEMGEFVLEKPFTEYVDEVTNLDNLENLTTEEWATLAMTLDICIKNDLTHEFTVIQKQADAEGKFLWSDIPKGLYLVLGKVTNDGKYIYTPNPTLVTVPNRNAQGQWDSHPVVLHTKAEIEEITGDTVEYSVRKIWEDGEHEEKRPENITVTLLMDGEVYDTVTLSVENNWSYTWSDLEAGHEWKADESAVPREYTKKIELDGKTCVITNTYKETPNTPDKPDTPGGEKLPQTGQLWWPVPILVLLGIVAFIIGWVRRRTDD